MLRIFISFLSIQAKAESIRVFTDHLLVVNALRALEQADKRSSALKCARLPRCGRGAVAGRFRDDPGSHRLAALLSHGGVVERRTMKEREIF